MRPAGSQLAAIHRANAAKDMAHLERRVIQLTNALILARDELAAVGWLEALVKDQTIGVIIAKALRGEP